MTTHTISRACAGHMHSCCPEPDTCACPTCHKSCDRCGGTNLQSVEDGICASCRRAAADRNAGAYTPCDNDPRHGRAFRNPGTRRNEFLCRSCHAKSGHAVPMRQVDVEAVAGCVTADISSSQHQWTWIRGNKFGCVCGGTKYDAKLRKEMRS